MELRLLLHWTCLYLLELGWKSTLILNSGRKAKLLLVHCRHVLLIHLLPIGSLNEPDWLIEIGLALIQESRLTGSPILRIEVLTSSHYYLSGCLPRLC